ncbi:aminotransferase class IV [Streptomyces luteogriseus]|uniref:aminotransferase class IV n=1 Tax=Streptomyces luteogriseus TaxID=68233 RepID=UPI0037A8A60E
MSEAPTAVDPRMTSGCAWIDGVYVPSAEARIPILDTGFVRSDLTYDVAAVWKGKFFRLDQHLDRVLAGAGKLRITSPLTKAEIRTQMHEVVRRSGLRDAYVEVVITRGVPAQGERDPRRWAPRIYVYAIPYVWIVRPELQEAGTAVVIARDTYRIPPTSVDPTIKNFHWGDLVRGLFEAYDRDAWLAIHTDGSGHVTEGAGFNVFALVDDVLVTPERGVLEGITRRTVLEIAAELGIPTRVGLVEVEELSAASEIFLTSTAGGVMPVATVDGRAVTADGMGPVTRRVRDTYWAWHEDPRFVDPVQYR